MKKYIKRSRNESKKTKGMDKCKTYAKIISSIPGPSDPNPARNETLLPRMFYNPATYYKARKATYM
jgi:hypothetical protein